MTTYLSHPPALTQTKTSKRQFLVLILSAALGGVVAFLAIERLMTPTVVANIKSLNGWETLVFFALLPVFLWLIILIHELGHLLTGWLAGMRPVFLFAGPLKVVFVGSRPTCHWNRSLSTWGGLALSLPTEGPLNRKLMAIYVVGGPLASLIFAFIAGWLASHLTGIGYLLVGLFAVTSGILAVATLIPFVHDGFVSDGGQLLQLVRNKSLVQARMQTAFVVGESLSGVRPRDWSVATLKEIVNSVSNPMLRVSALSVIASSTEDTGNDEEALIAYEALAKQLHEGGLAAYPSAFRGDMVLPIAIFLGERLKDAESAQRWLDTGRKSVMDRYLVPFAEAACAAARGDLQSTRNSANEALNLISDNLQNGTLVAHRERLTKLAQLFA